MIRPVNPRGFLSALFLFCLLSAGFSQTALIPLAEAARKVNAGIDWDPLSGLLVLERDGYRVQLRPGEQLVLFNYETAELLDPPVKTDRGIFLTQNLVNRLVTFFTALPAPENYRIGAILIDPGHGGRDPGAVGKTTINGKTVEVIEKNIVLTVGLDVYNRLRAAYPDKKILMTRTGDTFPSLEQRVEMANSIKLAPHEAVLYISIHANAAFNTRSKGFEVWYLSPDYRRTVIDSTSPEAAEILPILNSMLEEEFTTESILIAKSIMDNLVRQIGSLSPNRGLKEEAWFVVRNARMPSVLVELGFVSNPEEARLLSDEEYLRKCALGIYNGVASFISHFEGSRGLTSAHE